MRTRIYFLALFLVASRVGLADIALPKAAIFSRCYSQLTQLRILASSQLLAQVRANTKDPVDACLEVLDRANLSKNNVRIGDETDPVAKAVLYTMHKMHASFFTRRDFAGVGRGSSTLGVKDLWDAETPALYYTRALFRPNTPFKTIVTESVNLRAIRTDDDPSKGTASGKMKADTIFGETVRFAGKGELLGITAPGEELTHYDYVDDNGKQQTGDVKLGAHFGGGILGNQLFLLQNVNDANGFRANGGEKMPRRWAKAVYNDLLCRELPVVRYIDVAAFKKANSPVPFRTKQGCVTCHASMDRMAAVVRGFTYMEPGTVNGKQGANFVDMVVPTLGDGTAWPTTPDSNYFKKDPNGVLFFRNHQGELIDIPVKGAAEMGAQLANQEDLYLCAAKRYYSYFMGIDVSLEDPKIVGALSATDLKHLHNVEALAAKLHTTQSLRELVKAILSLPEYQRSSFGAVR